ERDARVDRDRALLTDDGPPDEGRGVRELVRRLPAHAEGLRRLRARRVAALGRPAHLARPAPPAVRERREDDGVALLDGGDAVADGVDHGRTLVPEDDRGRIRDRAVDDAQVRVAEAGGLDRDAHLAGARVRDPDLLDRDRAAAAVEDRSDHVHAGLPTRSTRPVRTPVRRPSSTTVSPFTITRTTPSGSTCQRSSPPGMSRTSCFLPRARRDGSNIMTSAW